MKLTGRETTCKKDSDDRDLTGLFAVQSYPSLLEVLLFVVIKF